MRCRESVMPSPWSSICRQARAPSRMGSDAPGCWHHRSWIRSRDAWRASPSPLSLARCSTCSTVRCDLRRGQQSSPSSSPQVDGKAPHELVFPAARSGRPSSGHFDAAAKAIGLPALHPHQLRHTAASLAIASGADVKVVQQMLGHSSATMTRLRARPTANPDLPVCRRRAGSRPKILLLPRRCPTRGSSTSACIGREPDRRSCTDSGKCPR